MSDRLLRQLAASLALVSLIGASLAYVLHTGPHGADHTAARPRYRPSPGAVSRQEHPSEDVRVPTGRVDDTGSGEAEPTSRQEFRRPSPRVLDEREPVGSASSSRSTPPSPSTAPERPSSSARETAPGEHGPEVAGSAAVPETTYASRGSPHSPRPRMGGGYGDGYSSLPDRLGDIESTAEGRGRTGTETNEQPDPEVTAVTESSTDEPVADVAPTGSEVPLPRTEDVGDRR